MSIEEISKILNCRIDFKAEDFSQSKDYHFMTTDLMSEVLVEDRDDLVLITALCSGQVARTADITGVRAVVLVNSKSPQPELLRLCKEMEISLLRTSLSAFKCCYLLGKAQEGHV